MKPKVSTFTFTFLVMALMPFVAKAVDYSGFCGDPNINEGQNVRWRVEANNLINKTEDEPVTYTLFIEGSGPMVEGYHMQFGYNNRPWRDWWDYITHIEIGEGVTHLSASAMNGSKVKTYSFPSTLESIGESAFYECINLTSIEIPGTVKTIGVSAFDNCKNLEKIILNKGLQSIGKCAFRQHSNENSTKLKSITIPSTVTEIGDGAFSHLYGLTEIILEEGLTVFGGFNYVGVTEVVIPSSVTTINQNALSHCPNLKKIVIGEGVTSIGLDAFDDNPKLEMVVCLPTTVPEGHRPFYPYQNREGFVMVVPAEAYDAYYNNWYDVKKYIVIGGVCGNLTWTYNPSTKALSLLGEGAMPDYDQIENVPWNVYAQEIMSFHIGSGVTYVSNSAFKNYAALTTISVEAGSASYVAEGNCLIHTATSSVVLGCNGSLIPSTATTIKQGAFYECATFTNLTLPANITCVEGGAFIACPITSITVANNNLTYHAEGNCLIETASNTLVLGCEDSEIPTATIKIGDYAFACCKGISSIILPENITTIGDYAFSGCTELSEVYSYAAESPSIETTTFTDIHPEAILYHPSGSDYSAWAPYFKELKYIAKDLETIADGNYEIYDSSFDMPVNTLIYSRTLPNLHWNALYVPFKIPYEAVAENYEVSYINAVHSYDNDDNGTIDELSMEVVKIKSGTLKANYPYLIKARNEEDKEMTLELEDAVLYAAEENAVNCASVYQNFEITGNYSRKSAEDLSESLAISTTGAWQPLATGTYLNPFRLYLTITNRDDSPVEVEPVALSRIRIIENGETTSIIDLTPTADKETYIYDLSGRRVVAPIKGKLYIVNGKKVLF